MALTGDFYITAPNQIFISISKPIQSLPFPAARGCSRVSGLVLLRLQKGRHNVKLMVFGTKREVVRKVHDSYMNVKVSFEVGDDHLSSSPTE